MQVIFAFHGGPEEYARDGAHRKVARPDDCPICGKLGEMRAPGYYSRSVSAPGKIRLLLIQIRRFLCRACRRTTSMLGPAPEYPLSSLLNFIWTKQDLMEEMGVEDLRHVPDEYLSDIQALVKEHTAAGTVFFDAEGAAADLAPYGFPCLFSGFRNRAVYGFDLERYTPASTTALQIQPPHPRRKRRHPTHRLSMKFNSLIEDHLFLVEVIAFDYANIPGCQLGEALSDGNLALVRAAQAYDPSRGEFIPFASRVIRNALNSLYAKQLRILKMFPKSIDDPIQWPQASATGSIESQSDHSAHADSGPDTLKGIRIRETLSAIESAMNLLTPRERLVINAFRVGASFPEIGERLGISKQAAHKSVKSGLMKLRNGLARMGYRGLATDGQLGSLKSEKLPPRG